MEIANKNSNVKSAEPWLRGTMPGVPPVLRAVLHALQLAEEDVIRFCGCLTTEELRARPFGIASVAFHIRHISGSVDRLLTYAEGRPLSEEQAAAAESELEENSSKDDLFAEFHRRLTEGEARIRNFDPAILEDARTVGRKHLPTTVAGLLIHIADHTQRHVGQAVTTSKIVAGQGYAAR